MPAVVAGQQAPLISEALVAPLAQELSGEAAKRNLEFLSRLHRMRGSRGFHAAIMHLAEQARSYGLADIHVDSFPADGKTFYGTQKARPAWDADFAELWELRSSGGRWTPAVRLASWDALPISLTEDSDSAEVEADLVDVGEGTTENDYVGKEVRGKIVLAAGQPGPVAPLAVARYGALGVLSYAQNQHTAWWGEDENLIRWGHLDSYAPFKTFGFQVSLKVGRELRQRLNGGEAIRLKATVRAARRPGYYEVLTATIPGADPRLREEEIAFSCHLDHQRPGANDNASGCATILEVARTLSKLIAEGKISRPARTLRFIWPPEMEGTSAWLNSRPALAGRIKGVIHMDMVGGGAVTKSIFHAHRGPASLPSFVSDVGQAVAEWVNQQSLAYASTGKAVYPLVAPEGSKEPLGAELAEFSRGSDHEIYTDASFAIPAIYLADWPDRYIHTNFDAAANIDPTKLKRAAFIGAASGHILANLSASDGPALWNMLVAGTMRRTGTMLDRRAALPVGEAAALTRFHWEFEQGVVSSIERFFKLPEPLRAQANDFLARLESATAGAGQPTAPSAGDGALVFARNPAVKGPMSVFAYDYFTDHYGPERAGNLRLLQYQGLRAAGDDYAYEVLNLADGRRTAQRIRDAASAIYGPVPLELIVEYLRALDSIGVLHQVR